MIITYKNLNSNVLVMHLQYITVLKYEPVWRNCALDETRLGAPVEMSPKKGNQLVLKNFRYETGADDGSGWGFASAAR